ncbi:vaculolar membrane protein (macronuclear) [Tetrahymena thermophila SB210]|uniref:Vaculolar membrane protein n=1 Tax=Tetrahymena thermophila (strain SB210) TaxID=312017 RepID=I7M0Q8_TETTS|nr:vaculolar membrane protein [Tetrahymena thermophila SB210]EAR90760.3 vaculolar membrane protein [Tetrahymena thermophila SB210]|eukprot:XP_001011005.3 vaculolar membrane protein [Tetrahymena thermophila SB210]
MPSLQRNVLLKHQFKYQAIPVNLMNIEINLERQQCELMGAFGVTVQVILGLLSFSILLLKQLNSSTKRSWRIWCMDTSKQAIGSFYIHTINVIISNYLTYTVHPQNQSVTACNWYLVNYLQDFILGNSMNFFVVYMIKKFNDKYKIPALQFGQYNSQQTIEDYYPQLLAWLILISINKIILMSNIFIFSKFFHEVGDSLLRNLKNYPKTQLILVVVVIPLIFNTISYWTTDSFLRSKDENQILSQQPYEKIQGQINQEGDDEEEEQETKFNSNQDLFNNGSSDELNSTQEIFSEDNLKFQQI